MVLNILEKTLSAVVLYCLRFALFLLIERMSIIDDIKEKAQKTKKPPKIRDGWFNWVFLWDYRNYNKRWRMILFYIDFLAFSLGTIALFSSWIWTSIPLKIGIVLHAFSGICAILLSWIPWGRYRA